MIPIGDENPTRTKPYVVYALVALNVVVYLYDRIGASTPLGNLWNWSMIPYSVIHDVRVMPLFNQVGQIVAARPLPGVGPDPQWITIFTSMFMHASLLHIGGNMLYLWIFGNNIEDALGHAKFLAFYLGCGVAAAFTHIALNLNSVVPTVGASGAIAGVLGAYLYLYPGNRIRTLLLMWFFWVARDIPALFVLGIWFLTQLLGLGGSGGQIGGGVAYGAHVGGFAAGVIAIVLLGGRSLRRQQPRYYYRRLHP